MGIESPNYMKNLKNQNSILLAHNEVKLNYYIQFVFKFSKFVWPQQDEQHFREETRSQFFLMLTTITSKQT